MAESTPQYGISAAERQQIKQEILVSLQDGSTPVTISDSDKADIIAEVLAELYAKSQDTKTLEKVGNLDGITSIPAVRDDNDIVSVPLDLLKTNVPKEISEQQDLAVLQAQGKLIVGQLYYIPEES